jgi:hypothetical protein
VLRGTLLVCLCSVLTACASLRSGGAPQPAYDVNHDLEQLATQFDQANAITNFYKNPSKEVRDQFITGRLVLINIRYIQFIRESTVDKQLVDSAVAMLNMALSLTGASVASAGAKTALAAAVAGVTGSKETIDKNYYFEKTLPALIGAMNAERKKMLVPILLGMRGSLEEYPFAQAVTDLHSYYYAGTFAGAIEAIEADAGAKEQRQDQILATLSPVSAEDVATKASLTRAIGALEPSDMEKIRAALKLLDSTVAPADTFTAAQTQLQAYVRGARTPSRITEVAQAFKDAGINF